MDDIANFGKLHKLFNEHLANAYWLSFGNDHFLNSLVTMVIQINTVSPASVIIPLHLIRIAHYRSIGVGTLQNGNYCYDADDDF